MSLNHHRNLGGKGLPPTPCTEEETEAQRRPKTDPQQRKSRESSTPAPGPSSPPCPQTAPRGWLLPRGDERPWPEETGSGGPQRFLPAPTPLPLLRSPSPGPLPPWPGVRTPLSIGKGPGVSPLRPRTQSSITLLEVSSLIMATDTGDTTTPGTHPPPLTGPPPHTQTRDGGWGAHLRGLRWMQTRWARPLRKAGGLSWTTCCTRRRHLTYSSRRRRKPRKCSAVRMEPGTASAGRRAQPGAGRGGGARGRGGGRGSPCSTSSGSTGLARWASVSRAALASRSPSTRRRYSSRSRCSSVSLILREVEVWEELGHLGGWSGARVYGLGHPHLSTVFCRVSRLAWQRSRVRRVRLTLMESMQTLSGKRTGLRQADAAAAEGLPRLPTRLSAHRCCGPRQRRPRPCGPAPWTPGRQSWGPAGSGSCRPPRWRVGSGGRGGRVTPARLPVPTPRAPLPRGLHPPWSQR